MDTSELRIKMSETAVELQKLWKRNQGDEFFLRDRVKPGGKTRTYILGCHWEKCPGCDYESDKTEMGVWVPSQEQLQDMLIPEDEKDSRGKYIVLLDDFQDWVLNDCTGLEWSHKIDPSMEQLWLAYVMKEKFKKYWNGKDWEDIK
jgi:hypothetical protein